MISVSVIMPVLNEEQNIAKAIERVLKAFQAISIDGEIIIVNDGSQDKTFDIVKKLKKNNPSIRIISHAKPLGIGQSFWDGIKIANKELTVMIPGDNENDPNEIFRYICLMRDVDIIVPFIYNIEVRDRFRRILSSLYRLIINISFGTNFNYTNGTILYRKCILKDISLKATGFFYQAEILVKLIRKGYLFSEVPYFMDSRTGEQSKALSWRSLYNVIRGYLHLFFDIHVRRIEGRRNSEYLNLNRESVTYSKMNDRKLDFLSIEYKSRSEK